MRSEGDVMLGFTPETAHHSCDIHNRGKQLKLYSSQDGKSFVRDWPELNMCARTVGSANGTTQRRFRVRVSRNGETAVLHCCGQIRFKDDAARFSEALIEQMNSGRNTFLEFSSVKGISTAGICELALAYMHAKARRCSLGLIAPADIVKDLFEPTNMTSLLETYPTLEAALNSSDEVD